jgi:hypothetical protein
MAPHLFEKLPPGIFGRREDNAGEFRRFIFLRADGALLRTVVTGSPVIRPVKSTP